eukprot:CAMPEP_0183485152 /NCGR_PEP_ID=MMETSP0370-20130417/179283_1 /TAXON_ID=268820 /ORGANISM="Peridinium aciculiferum, Strain PAER-2" /LENGTH=288 /DNA_ID=CAMNT_0025678449 /DNA_START=1 /DNA_END=868 /DNA_ORIENTATION=-
MTWGEAARRDGAPPIKIAGVDVNDMLDGIKALPLAGLLSKAAVEEIPGFVGRMSKRVNDGFFLTYSPAALAAAYFVEPSKAFAAMDYLRKVQLESKKSKDFVWNLPGEFRFLNVQDSAVLQPVKAGIWFNAQMISFADLAKNDQAWKRDKVQLESKGSKDFVWNLPGEFRFLNVQDSAVLQPVKAGIWFNAQMISFADLAKNDQAWKRDFKKVEDYWVKELKAQPHMGKLFGFETGADGAVVPFADSYSCTIYSDDQKASFEAYRHQQDPEGLFATGLGMKFLSPCAN